MKAFPTGDVTWPNGQIQLGEEGMDLRDYFAAAAMAGFMSRENVKINQLSIDLWAGAAYITADAMMAVRDAKPKEAP